MQEPLCQDANQELAEHPVPDDGSHTSQEDAAEEQAAAPGVTFSCAPFQ